MRMQVLCFVLLAGLFASTGARLLTAPDDAPIKQLPNFDYFLFVQQSPGSFCAARGSCPLVHLHDFKFTIHGLWPENRDGTWPQFCDNTAYFHEDVLRDILPEMREYWPSYMDNNDQFWQHEWAKHGTCALSIIDNEKNFFSTVLDLHREYDLGAALSAKDIVPSATAHYSVADVRSAIADMYDVEAVVHCDAHGQLSEVWICLTRELKPMNCPVAAAPTCKDVRIPPMPSAVDDASTQTEDKGEDEEEEEGDQAMRTERDEEESGGDEEGVKTDGEGEEEEEEEDGWVLVEKQHGKEKADAATQTGGAEGQVEGDDDDEEEKEEAEEEEEEKAEEEEEEEQEDEPEARNAAPRVHAGQGGSGAAVSQLHWVFPAALLLASVACVGVLAGLLAAARAGGRRLDAAAARRPWAEEDEEQHREAKPLLL